MTRRLHDGARAPLTLTLPLPGVGPGNGQISLNYNIPPTASSGAFTLQALIIDGGASGGFAVTNGVQMTIQ